METTTVTQPATQHDPVKGEFAAALRQYQYFELTGSLDFISYILENSIIR